MPTPFSFNEGSKENLFQIEGVLDITQDTDEDERISLVEAYQANVYIGTSTGRLLHYYKFEDAEDLILISQINGSESGEKVEKASILDEIERIIILCGDTLNMFTIPELSPSNIVPIKGIKDFSMASSYKREGLSLVEVVLAFESKIRLVEITTSKIRTLQEFSYSGKILRCLYCASEGRNDMGKVLVASETKYDLIDFKEDGATALFEYDPTHTIRTRPRMIAFSMHDEGKKEYLLTMASDGLINMAMFMNSSFEVTRGTLIWTRSGSPEGGIITMWPFIVSICIDRGENDNAKYNLVWHSLHDLNICASCDLQGILGDNQGYQNLSKKESEDVKISGEADMKPSSVPYIHEGQVSYFIKKSAFSLSKVDELRYNIIYGEPCASLSAVVDPSDLYYTEAIIHSRKKVWAIYPTSKIVLIQRKILKQLSIDASVDEEVQILKSSQVFCSNREKSYCFQLLFLLILYNDNYDDAVSFLFDSVLSHFESLEKIEIDPRLLISLFKLEEKISSSEALVKDYMSSFKMPGGLKQIIETKQLHFSKSQSLTKYYIQEICKLTCSSEREDDSEVYRLLTYKYALPTEESIIDFINTYDKTSWIRQYSSNFNLKKSFKDRNYNKALILIFYMETISKKSSSDSKMAFCELAYDLLNSEVDVDTKYLSFATIKVGDNQINLIDAVLQNLDLYEGTSTYRKFLLGVLKLNPEKTLEYMKARDEGELKDLYYSVINEFSNTDVEDSKILKVKITYLESTLMRLIDKGIIKDNLNIVEELIVEQLKLLVLLFSRNDDLKIEFKRLEAQFRTQNDIKKDTWPKQIWPKFLASHEYGSLIDDFILLYSKCLELSMFLTHFITTDRNKIKAIYKQIEEHAFLEYFLTLFDENKALDILLEKCDFSNAEEYSSKGTIALAQDFYSMNNVLKNAGIWSSETSKLVIEDRLLHVLRFYFKLEDNGARDTAVMQFLEKHGEVIDPKIIIQESPSDIPIVYLESFLADTINRTEISKVETQLRKVLSRVDSTRCANISKFLS